MNDKDVNKIEGPISELSNMLGIKKINGASTRMFHHTNTEALLSMLESGRMRLSRVDAMNDGTENFKGAKRTYVLSLSTAVGESIAMWVVYGRPRKGAIRLHFSGKEILNIANNGHLDAYPVVKGVAKNKPAHAKAAVLSHVCYLSGNGQLAHYGKDTTFVFNDGRRTVSENMECLRGVSKLYGWSYERECRLAVTLNKEIAAEKIEVDFTPVFKKMLGSDKKTPSILTGPWMERDRLLKRLEKWVKVKEKEKGDNKPKLLNDVKAFVKRARDMSNGRGPISESMYKGLVRIDPCGGCAKKKGDCANCEGPRPGK